MLRRIRLIVLVTHVVINVYIYKGNCEDFAKAYMEGEYETNSSLLLNQATIAEWNYETNLTELNGNLSVRMRTFLEILELSIFE